MNYVVAMEITTSLCCKELKNCDVIDSTGEKIGRIGEMTFSFDGQLKPSKFILIGSRWEEFLESIGAKPDRDPVFDISLIERIGEEVHLNTTCNSLATTLDEGAIPTTDITLSKIENMDIIDNSGVKVGRAIDIDFDVDGTASLTVGGGIIEETLEALGLKADVDIIVPASTIESITDIIKLTVSKDELQLTMDGALKTREEIMAKEARDTHRGESKVRLFTHRPM